MLDWRFGSPSVSLRYLAEGMDGSIKCVRAYRGDFVHRAIHSSLVLIFWAALSAGALHSRRFPRRYIRKTSRCLFSFFRTHRP